MKIAIPTAKGKLCMHFGHCEVFAIVDIDEETKTVKGSVSLDPPAHEPGVFPKWLSEQGANTIISGGMGMRARQIFEQYGINVVTGASPDLPESVAQKWINGELEVGENICDH